VLDDPLLSSEQRVFLLLLEKIHDATYQIEEGFAQSSQAEEWDNL
jgi:hypothetical protein